MSRHHVTKITSALGLIALTGAALVGCQSAADGEGSADTQTVRLGVIGASDPYWSAYEEVVEKELDIDLEIVDFGEYNLPNPSLNAGELDINQFQHIIYLAEHIDATGDDLVPIGSTAIYPLTVHSKKYDSIEEIPEGSKVAVPDDPSNKARALLVLQQAGLIELEGGGNTGSTADDVLPSSKVEVTELDASFTATSLDDVAAAVINNDFVERAGLNFDDAIFKDDPNDPSSLPYVNIFVVRGEDKDNEIYQRLVEIYHSSEEVLDGVQEVSGGSAVIADIPTDELEEALQNELDVISNS